MEKTILTRRELYDLLWAEPMSSLIEKYNISYTQLKKQCAQMNIPIPANGHWSKISFGKPVMVTELPENYSGINEIVLDKKSTENDSHIAIRKKLSDAIESNSDLTLRVPERLTNPDILITNTKNYYDAVKRFDWRSESSYPSHKDVLNIRVSQDKLPRALRFMDTIIKLLRARNHDIKFKYDNTYAVIDGGDIEIRLKEKNRVSEVKDQYGSRQLVSTGKFVFIIGDYHPKEVGDGRELLETKLAIILAKLEAEGKREKEERIANEEWRKKYEEQQRIEKEIRELKEKESRAFKELFLQASRMHQANIMRNYIAIVETNAIKSGNLSEELNNWIIWAKQKVEWYDPLINREDTLLNDNYKTNVFKDFIKEWQ